MLTKFHPYHMVSNSPWPILAAIYSWNMLSTVIICFSINFSTLNSLLMAMISLIAYFWWVSVTSESTNQGNHQKFIEKNLKIGMILFIVSEIMFFSAFFWTYFHSSLSPNMEMNMVWPPLSVIPFNPINIPLLNTIILVSSGATITWAHHEMMKNNYMTTIIMTTFTLILGVYFTMLQYMEYNQAEFSLSDSTFGSIFFMATGFHGIHVIIGTTFILSMCIRLLMINNSNPHNLNFELSAWYWHFVDVVWLFLYISIYWWGY